MKAEDYLSEKSIVLPVNMNVTLVSMDDAIEALRLCRKKQGEQKPIISNDALREGIAHFGITQYQIDNWLKKYIDVEKQDEQKSIYDLTQQEAMDIAVDKCFEQGEQKPVVIPKFRIGDIIKCTEDGEVFTIRTITKDKYIYTDDSFDWIKDQDEYELVEQKTTDKVEPKFKVKYAGSEYNVLEVKDIAGVTYYGIEDEPNHIDYVQAENCERVGGYGIKENGFSVPTKPIMFSEQKPQRIVSAEAKEAMYDKPAWSEEDKNLLNRLIGVLDGTNKEDYHEAWEEKFLPWLKSLKDRVQPQPKQEWSQNDIDMIDWLIRCCEKEHEELCNDKYGHQDIVSDLKRDCRKKWNWLESLKNKVVPQNRWKPSDEQIHELGIVATGKGWFNKEILSGLLEQLKKLREKDV